MAEPVILAKELEVLGCRLETAEFREMVTALHTVMNPGWSDEELLYHPQDAAKYCDAARRRAKCKDLPDHLILRTLVNTRKQKLRVAR